MSQPPTAAATAARPRLAWRAYAALGALVVVAHALLPAWGDATYLAVGASAVVAVVGGVLVHRPRSPHAWWCLAAGLAAWVVGDAVLVVDSALAARVADGVYLLGYLLLAAGLGLLARARSRRRHLSAVLDAWTVTVSLGLVVYVLLGQAVVVAPAYGPGATATLLAFLAADILLLGALLRVAMTPGAWQAVTVLLTGALGLVVLADLVSLALELGGRDVPVALDLAWLLAYVLWGAAALHPSMVVLSLPSSSEGGFRLRVRLVVGAACLTLPTLVLVVQQLLGQDPSVWPAYLGSLVLVALVTTRQRLAYERIREVNVQAHELQEQLAYEATHDALTLLPNRSHGLTLLEQALQRARRDFTTTTCLFIDLDGFKQVNDTLGHAAGDQLLRRVAERLQRAVRGDDTAIRLGGDEFVVLLDTVADTETAQQIATRLIETISRPVTLGRLGAARVGASIGIARAVNGQADPESLLAEADAAAYRAKQGGRGRAEVFDLAMREELLALERRSAELRLALDRDELLLHYQPVIDSMTGEVRGYEALVRWQHPREGLLQPADFLPVAEAADLIGDLDRWVLERATTQLQQWVTEDGFDHLVVAVNVSATSAARTRIVDDVRRALRISGLRADRLVLELPERVLEDRDRTVLHLHQVRDLGVSVSVADFGSGVSSLARLADLPVNVVKVARASLDLTSPLGDKLLQLMIQGAHAVGLNAVAEGVERDDQLATLRALDCEMVQGFHIAHPLPAADVVAYHEAQTDRFSGLLR